MQTNITIDDALMQEAMTISGLETENQAVEEALRLLVKLKQEKSKLDNMLLDGINSGTAIKPDADYWENQKNALKSKIEG